MRMSFTGIVLGLCLAAGAGTASANQAIQRGLAHVEGVQVIRPWVLKVRTRGSGTWIFHPESDQRTEGLHSFFGIHNQTRGTGEMGTYVTSKHLGLGVVGKTVRGLLRGQRGTFTRYIEGSDGDASAVQTALTTGRVVDWDSMHGVAILHFVTNEADAKPNNLIMGTGEKLRMYAIDGESSFGSRPTGRGFPIYLPADTPRQLSDKLWARIRRVNVDKFASDLGEAGLSPDKIAATIARLKLVQEHGLSAPGLRF